MSDADGDGLLDFLVTRSARVCEYITDPTAPLPGPHFVEECVPASRAPAGAQWVDHFWVKPGPFTGIADGLIEVRTGDHTVATAEYELSRHSGAQCDYPLQCHSNGTRVVSAHTDALDRRYRHHYRGARSDLRGQGFLGFTRHYIVSEANGSVREIQFDQTRLDAAAGYALAMIPMHEVDYVPLENGRFLAEESIDQYEVLWLSERHHTVVLRNRITRSYDLDARPPGGCVGDFCQDLDLDGLEPLRELHLQRDYDARGVLRRQMVSSGQLLLLDVNITTEDRPTTWQIGLPSRVSVVSRANVGGEVEAAERVSTFVYDPLGFLRKHTIEPDRPELSSIVEYEPDEFGHIKQITQSAAGIEPRITRLEREDREHIFLHSTRNPLGHEEVLAIHPTLGLPVLVRDPNDVEARATYDGFGRMVMSYDDAAPSAISAVRFQETDGDRVVVNSFAVGHSHSETQVDHLGRVHTARERLPDGSWTETELVYDALGRLAETVGPRQGIEPSYLHRSYHYDAASRLVAVDFHDGERALEHQYLGLESVTIDRRGNEHHSRVDELGRSVWARSDVDGEPVVTTRTFGPFSTLRLVTDAAGNRYETWYDPYSRPTYREDPDAGDRAFEYDTLGQPTIERDGAGTAISEIRRRDRLGRVLEQWALEDGTTTFEWDSVLNGIGLLGAAETGLRYRVRTEHRYSRGHLTSLTQTINGLPLTVSRTFDDYGRLETLSYPETAGGGLTVGYDYGPANVGGVTAIRNLDSGQQLWQAEDWDALGRIVRETQGNGHVTRRWFDERTGRLQRIAVTGSVMEIGYGYDADGNVARRIDHELGRSETFDHDALGRLTSWRPSWVEPTTYEYDAIGNLTRIGEV
ncbi:MAG: hypothetical protein K8H88_07100, partial [Sandaracinaceae bacterium]|nr:hypothetical protein [Sandaracinaceae bacterium]